MVIQSTIHMFAIKAWKYAYIEFYNYSLISIKKPQQIIKWLNHNM